MYAFPVIHVYLHLPCVNLRFCRSISKAKAESKEPPAYLLYVQRAQSRAERKAALEEERSCLARFTAAVEGEKGRRDKMPVRVRKSGKSGIKHCTWGIGLFVFCEGTHGL